MQSFIKIDPFFWSLVDITGAFRLKFSYPQKQLIVVLQGLKWDGAYKNIQHILRKLE